jgi:N-acetyl sugar amidotransferase
MDTSDPDISFDNNGICNWCIEAEEKLPLFMLSKAESERRLDILVKDIKSKQTGQYDSIIGLSGGVDSSYLAYWAHRAGLKPLTVHFDNGWNSETAVSNIKKIIDKCGFDLETYMINWPEFRDLQRSFLKAGVIDIEMLTDHAIMASLRTIMKKHGISCVISGANYATEHGLPAAWVWPKGDWTNIKGIHKRFGTVALKTYPHSGIFSSIIAPALGLAGKIIQPLDLMSYSKERAMIELSNEFDWKYYGGKHYESIFTKFYQAYILPVKFGVDKRRSHLSCLIRTGEISKQSATEELSTPLYDEVSMQNDKSYVCKKLGFSESEFDRIMQEPPHAHNEYPTNQALRKIISALGKIFFSKK